MPVLSNKRIVSVTVRLILYCAVYAWNVIVFGWENFSINKKKRVSQQLFLFFILSNCLKASISGQLRKSAGMILFD
jgi:hypothetical protein